MNNASWLAENSLEESIATAYADAHWSSCLVNVSTRALIGRGFWDIKSFFWLKAQHFEQSDKATNRKKKKKKEILRCKFLLKLLRVRP